MTILQSLAERDEVYTLSLRDNITGNSYSYNYTQSDMARIVNHPSLGLIKELFEKLNKNQDNP